MLVYFFLGVFLLSQSWKINNNLISVIFVEVKIHSQKVLLNLAFELLWDGGEPVDLLKLMLSFQVDLHLIFNY